MDGLTEEEINEINNEPFSLEEGELSIDRLAVGKCDDPDGLSVELIKPIRSAWNS